MINWRPLDPAQLVELLQRKDVRDCLSDSGSQFYQHILEDVFSYNCGDSRVETKKIDKKIKQTIRELAHMMLNVVESDNPLAIRAVTAFISKGTAFSDDPLDVLIHALSNLRLTPKTSEDVLVAICGTADESVIDAVSDLPDLATRRSAMSELLTNENLTDSQYEKLLDRALIFVYTSSTDPIIRRATLLQDSEIIQKVADRAWPPIHLALLANPFYVNKKHSIQLIKKTGMGPFAKDFVVLLPEYEKTLSSEEIFTLLSVYAKAGVNFSELEDLSNDPLPKVATAIWKFYQKTLDQDLIQPATIAAEKQSEVLDSVFSIYSTIEQSDVIDRHLVQKIKSEKQALEILKNPSKILLLAILERENLSREAIQDIYRWSVRRGCQKEIMQNLLTKKLITKEEAEIIKKVIAASRELIK